MGEKECATHGVVKLMAIIALNTLNGDTELCLDIKKLDNVEKVSDLWCKGNVHRKCEQSPSIIR